jgi:type I restriction enzyme S subunit
MSEALRAGYKLTEVGVIPEDWEADSLGLHVVINSGYSPSLFRFETTGTPYFKVDQLNNEPKYLVTTPYFFRGEQAVPAGSLIFPKRGASILLNKVRILMHDAFMDTNLMTLTPNESMDSEYLYYALTYIQLWRIADTTSIPQINNKHITPLVLPRPQVAEQRAIAAALSDIDTLLAKLDTLIAKKRNIKQATMQQLLTGQTRLPGFSGEWEVKRLGELAHIKTGSKNNDDKVDGGEYPLFVRSQTVERINSYSYDCEAILVPGEGGIGSILHYVNGKFDCHQRVYKISQFNTDTCGKFIFYCMKQGFLDHATRNSVKATVDSLRLPTFKEFEFAAPTFDEQVAIASVLDDIDIDIEFAALETRRDKTLALKQGMIRSC